MTLLTTLWFAIVVPAMAGSAHVPTSHPIVSASSRTCPPDERNAEWRIRNILGSPLLAEMKQHVDLGTASLADIQLLRDPQDREACARLWDALEVEGTVLEAADGISFYRSGDRYFVPVSRRPPTPPGTFRLDGRSALHLYDAEYRLIVRMAA